MSRSPCVRSVDELLDPAAFLPGFDFQIVGETEIAGRPAIAVGRPRRAHAARAPSISSRTAPTP